jgi:hypothetical protein
MGRQIVRDLHQFERPRGLVHPGRHQPEEVDRLWGVVVGGEDALRDPDRPIGVSLRQRLEPPLDLARITQHVCRHPAPRSR